ncbi:calcium-binding protein [Phaeobacter marinintestinus]|uniref:calcium-binding protein n=1 Tax=Falsiphaeobacter marinintestinus TaxID=1492905 RepID=UPI0011B64AA5|nr:calcium-binding protein [Phaeobacter marinintestinus]
MFWLAGILGLMAVGSFVVGDSSDDESEMFADTGEEDDELEVAASMPDLLADTPGVSSEPTVDSATSPSAKDQIITGTQADEVLSGGSGDDQINGYSGDDIVEGGAGNDILHGADGLDNLRGGAGNDVLHGDDDRDILNGGSGQDAVFGHFGDDLLMGGAGDDTLEGGQDDDTLLGGAGSDGLLGGYGDDQLDGGSGADTLFGGWGDDLLNGREASQDAQSSDFLNGGGGSDTIIAGAADIVTAGDDADNIILGDWISGDDRAEVMDFDLAEDRLILSLDLEADPDPLVEIKPAQGHSGAVTVHVNGAEIALIHGGIGLSLEDITLISLTALPALNVAAE